MRLKNADLEVARVLNEDKCFAVFNDKLQELKDIRISYVIKTDTTTFFYTAKVDGTDIRLGADTKFYASATDFDKGNSIKTNKCRVAGQFPRPYLTRQYEDNTFELYTYGIVGCEVKSIDIADYHFNDAICVTIQHHQCTKVGVLSLDEKMVEIDTTEYYHSADIARYYCSYTERDAEGNEIYHPCIMDTIKPTEEQMALVKELEDVLARMNKANVRLICDRDDADYVAVNGNNLYDVCYDEPDMSGLMEVWDAVASLPTIRECGVIRDRWSEDGVYFKKK